MVYKTDAELIDFAVGLHERYGVLVDVNTSIDGWGGTITHVEVADNRPSFRITFGNDAIHAAQQHFEMEANYRLYRDVVREIELFFGITDNVVETTGYVKGDRRAFTGGCAGAGDQRAAGEADGQAAHAL